MATTIKWIDNNQIETAHRIYKSNTYFTKDNLPAPLVELDPDITEYVDSAGTDGENWYIVSALLNDYEVFSEPFIVGLLHPIIHDVFGDGSAVATYKFDGDATDLGGNYNGAWSGTEQYSSGGDALRDQAARFDSGVFGYIDIPNITQWNVSISFWLKSSAVSPIGRTMSFDIFSLFSDAIYLWDNKDGTGSHTIFNYDYSQYNPDSWNHIVITVDSSANIMLYINEVGSLLISSGSGSYGNYYGGGYIGVGAGNRGATVTMEDSFGGIIDNFRIFNRVLSNEEVTTIYEQKV